MKVAVLLKRVPDTGVSLRVNADGSDIVREGVAFVTNPYDEFAMEEAVRIKEARGDVQIKVFALGDESFQETLRTGLALGADEALLLKADPELDPLTAGKALAEAVKEFGPDLVLVGKEAVDDNMAAVHTYLAYELNYPIVHRAIKIELGDGEAVVTREADWGTERVKVKLPAVITCEKGLNEPRLPSLRGIMQAKRKKIEVREVSLQSAFQKLGLEMPPQKEPGRKVEEEFPKDVDILVEFLKERFL